MRITLLTIFIIIFSNITFAQYSIESDSALVLFYNFEDLENGYVKDLSSSRLNGKVNNIKDLHYSGYKGNAFLYSTSQKSCVVLETDSRLIPQEYTIMAWFKVNSWGTSHEGLEIIEKHGSYWIVVKTGNEPNKSADRGKMGIGINTKSSPGAKANRTRIITESPVVEPGKWYHVASVFDGNSISLFINGKFYASNNNVDAYLNNIEENKIVIGGKEGKDKVFINHWDGVIDEFYFFNRAFSELEISSYVIGKD